MTNLPAFSNYIAHLRGFIRENSRAAESRFNELARELFALQFAENEPYRKFCEARNVIPDKIEQWSSIPLMPTSAFKELNLTCVPAQARTRVFYSSGSTGENRSRHFHDMQTLAIYDASLLPWFRAHLVPDGESVPFMILTPPVPEAVNSSLVHMFDTVRKGFESSESTLMPRKGLGPAESVFVGKVGPDGAWEIKLEKETIEFLKAVSAAKLPVVVLGTAFNFVQLLDSLNELGLRVSLPAGSRALETGGYKGRTRQVPKTELYDAITKQLGIAGESIVSEYGMSELSSQAYDWVAGQSGPDRRIYRFPPWARVQLISAETGKEVGEGETGLIRVFDLANVSSVLAVQAEDLGVRCGGGFELIGRAAAAEARGCSLMSA